MAVSSSVIRRTTVSLLLFIMFLSSVSVITSNFNIIATHNETIDNSENSDFILDANNPIDDELNILNYNPVTNLTKSGSSFTARDRLSVDHELSLNLSYDSIEEKFTSDYNIDTLAGYNEESFQYGISEVRAKKDNYTIESLFDDEQLIEDPVYAIAQGFEIPWSYAVFYGALLNLDAIGGVSHTGNNYIELFLVRANITTGLPDLSSRISNETNGPYWRSNLPVLGSTVFYEFDDVILEQGFYFVIVNSSTYDAISSKKFAWRGHIESSGFGGDTYYYDSTDWSSLISIDHTLEVNVMPSDENGTKMIFADLDQILLEDNSIEVITFTDTISGTGLHHVTSDTSMEIDMINLYTFYEEKTANSLISAQNSTYGLYSISWLIDWNIDLVDYSPYTNLNRTQILFTPIDWGVAPSSQYNSTVLSTSKISDGYILVLGDIIEPGAVQLLTTSPNYIDQLVLSNGVGPTDTFTLGYWTTDEVEAYGAIGDTVYSTVNIRNSESTGVMNYTLFNSTGSIIPIKSSLPANIVYLDITPYTKPGISFSGPGTFSSDISLDPSVYGSDQAGFWTAYVYWENGTEVGLFSRTINIQESITFNASWETLPFSGVWTSDDSQIIDRINGDTLSVRASYFSNSEPFFTEFGTPIENASIGFTTSWGTAGDFDEYPQYFSGGILVAGTAGVQTINLVVNNTWSLLEMIEIQVSVFNIFSLEPVSTTVQANDTQEAILQFIMINETDPMKGAILPDDVNDIAVKINNNPVSLEFYNVTIIGEVITVSVDIIAYGITSGTANVSLTVTKANYRVSYSEEEINISYNVEVSSTPELPMMMIIISAVAVFIVILVISISFSVTSNRKRKSEIIDIKDKSKYVGLLESVLSMKKVLIIHKETSLPVFEVDVGQESPIESTLISGFLAALEHMGKTISGTDAGEIKKLQYRNFTVTSAKSETYTAFIFSTEELLDEFQVKLFDLTMWFEYSFKMKGKMWDGKKDEFINKRHLIQDKIADSLFVWIYFPLKFSKSKSGEIRKLDKSAQKIALYAKKKNEVAISEILKKFKETSIEEQLEVVFELVNKGILQRMQFSSFQR